MELNQKHTPVIVLMDKETAGEHSQIRRWLEDSRFATFEASNVFDALEQLSDFTIKSRPDVVLVDVECCDDEMPIMKNVSELPVVSVKSRSKGAGAYFASSVGQVASELNELIPH